MKTKQLFYTALVLTSFLTLGCKNDAGGTSGSATSSSEAPSDKTQSSGCTVAAVSGGAEITCGNTSAFIAHGTLSNLTKPILYDGGTNTNDQIGDYLISMTKSATGKELITVWLSSIDATAQYEGGFIHPMVDYTYYATPDCSGDAHYRLPSQPSQQLGIKGDHLIFADRYYKVGHVRVGVFPQSQKNSSGVCEAYSGLNFTAFKATPVDARITTVLQPGYRVKVQ